MAVVLVSARALLSCFRACLAVQDFLQSDQCALAVLQDDVVLDNEWVGALQQKTPLCTTL